MCTIGYDSCCFSYVAYLAIKFRSEQEMGRVGEVKSKVVPIHIMTAYGEWRNSSTHSQPWNQMEVSGQLQAQAALPPAPIGEEAACAPEPVTMLWRRKKFLLFCQDLNHDFFVVWHIACSHPNYYAMPAHQLWMLLCRQFLPFLYSIALCSSSVKPCNSLSVSICFPPLMLRFTFPNLFEHIIVKVS